MPLERVRRVVALYDIHGNVPALEAVLAEVAQAEVDAVVVGGDVVPGPMPREAVELLLEVRAAVHFIRGNGELAVLDVLAGRSIDHVPEQAQAVIRWTAAQLTEQHQRVMTGWPRTLRLEVEGVGDVLFCHATPRDENEIFTRRTAEARLAPIFAGARADLVVCGHTHMQFDRTVGETRVVNAGSVGMPFGVTGACWLRIGPGIELRHTPYDLEEAADRIAATQYPGAPEFARRYVLDSPSEDEMLATYARAEIRS